jgi:hypothetical protein
MNRASYSSPLAVLLASLSLLAGCSSSTPGRGAYGSDGGIIPGSTGGNGSGPAYCGALAVENECTCDTSNTAGLGPNGVACNPSTVGNGVCCGNIQWPGPGLFCTCQSYQCKVTSTDGSCQCGNGTTGPTQTCAPAAANFTCCQHAHSYCQCGPSQTCDPTYGDKQVAQCDVGSAQCQSSEDKVLPACQ